MDGTKATILIAEDSRFLRKATELILLKAGFSVITAEDGLETLQIARSLKPDLIVLDLMMPRLNGVEVIKELKQDGTTAKIPLVVLSVLSQQNEAKLMKVGAAAYYEKTKLVPEALVGIIQKVLHESRGETSNCAVQAIGPTEEADRDTLLTSNRNHREYEQQLFEQLISLNNELLAAQRELARTNEELKRIAATDELTGLANRRKATEDIQKLLALAQRHNQQIALAFLDLDNFKPHKRSIWTCEWRYAPAQRWEFACQEFPNRRCSESLGRR